MQGEVRGGGLRKKAKEEVDYKYLSNIIGLVQDGAHPAGWIIIYYFFEYKMSKRQSDII